MRKWNIEALWRRVRAGSDDGIREGTGLFDGRGVMVRGEGDFVPDAPLSFRAILRNGDMDRDIVLEELGERPFFSLLAGVARYPFLDTDVVPD